MQDRLQAIEDEYDRRFGDLIEWRMRETARARACTRYSVGTNQFHVEYGQNACTAAAAAAALYVLQYITSQEGVATRDIMPNLPWDNIVETGARLWTEYAVSRAGQQNPSGNVEFDELLACGGEYCTTVRRAFEVIVEIAGHTDDAVVAAMDAGAMPKTLCDTVVRIPLRSAAIVTATSVDIYGDGHGIGANAAAAARAPPSSPSSPPSSPLFPPDNNNADGKEVEVEDEDEDGDGAGGVGVTLAVVLLNGEYWIYDSHGAVDTASAALLCCCTTAEAAAEVLREQLPVGLYCATVVKRMRSHEQ